MENHDIIWQSLIAGTVTIILAWMQKRTQAAVTDSAKKAAVKVEEVKTTLVTRTESTDKKLDQIADTNDKIHTLVNSAMGAQLLIAKTALARIAATTNLPEDIAAGTVQAVHHGSQTMILATFTANWVANLAIWFIIIVAILALVTLFIKVSGVAIPPWVWQAIWIVVGALFFIALIVILVNASNAPGPMFGP